MDIILKYFYSSNRRFNKIKVKENNTIKVFKGTVNPQGFVQSRMACYFNQQFDSAK